MRPLLRTPSCHCGLGEASRQLVYLAAEECVRWQLRPANGEGALDMVDRDSERAGTGERVNGADETDDAAGLPTTREANALELADRGESRAGDDAHSEDRDAYDLDRGGKILETDALVMLLCRVEIGVSRVNARSTRIDASAAG